MSVLIKGFKMPEECRDCPLEIYYIHNGETRCGVGNKILAYNFKTIPLFDGRPTWCPLVEVPVPHSRLLYENDVIDAIYDRLHELQTHKEFKKKHGDIDLLGVMPYIAKIPTVIEAEETE